MFARFVTLLLMLVLLVSGATQMVVYAQEDCEIEQQCEPECPIDADVCPPPDICEVEDCDVPEEECFVDEAGAPVPGDTDGAVPTDCPSSSTSSSGESSSDGANYQPQSAIDVFWGFRTPGTVSMSACLINESGMDVPAFDASSLIAFEDQCSDIPSQYVQGDTYDPGNFSLILVASSLSQGNNYFLVYENGGTLAGVVEIIVSGETVVPGWTAISSDGGQLFDPMYPGDTATF